MRPGMVLPAPKKEVIKMKWFFDITITAGELFTKICIWLLGFIIQTMQKLFT